MPSIRIEAGAHLEGREGEVMRAVSEAACRPLSVALAQNDIVMTCRADGLRLVGEGRSERFCRVEIFMLAGRSGEQKAELRREIGRRLAAFGIADADLKLIAIDVPPENLGR